MARMLWRDMVLAERITSGEPGPKSLHDRNRKLLLTPHIETRRFQQRGRCLPYGGPHTVVNPPIGRNCPSNWYWHQEDSCCVPRIPDTPRTSCGEGWHWDNNEGCCKQYNQPQPSSNHWGRAGKKRTSNLCPADLMACPIAGAQAGSYECIDPVNELESCGGCASTGEGQDCTAIVGAWNVSCDKGTCVGMWSL